MLFPIFSHFLLSTGSFILEVKRNCDFVVGGYL